LISSLAENSSTIDRVKVADINITDDGLGTNILSLTGADASSFEIFDGDLYIKAGTVLDFEPKSNYAVTVAVDDTSVGATPDASVNFSLTLTDVVEAIIGTSADPETLNGGRGNDYLNGGVGNDSLNGGAGNDILDGAGDSTGLDTFAGGTGDDVYGVYNSDTVIIENAGEGVDNVWTAVSFTLPENVENLYLVGDTNGTGNDSDNIIYGYGLGNNFINGGAGSDSLYGGAGSDYLIGGSGSDYLDGGADNDVLDGAGDSAGLDTFAGGTGDDVYGVYNSDTVIIENAGEGVDSIWTAVDYTLPENVENLYLVGDTNGIGNAGDNIIYGYGVGSNIINGGAGNDSLYGGEGDDSILGGSGSDYLLGGLGTDYLAGGDDNDVLDGAGDSVGLDTFAGGAGDDVYGVYNSDTVIIEEASSGNDSVWTAVNYILAANVENLYLVGDTNGTGNAGDNTIVGYGAGDNVIDGGDGVDNLFGGAGNDTFILSKTSADNIGDFGVGNDRLQISASAFGGGLVAGAALQANQILVGANTANTVDQRFIFDTTNGDLFFDADGSDAVSVVVKIANLSGTSSLNTSSFVIV
jgi:Ca2+-binding RTX toxin-like protein